MASVLAMAIDANDLACALFDLDGTLCDSDPVHYDAFDALARARGRPREGLTWTYFREHIAGRANVDIFARLFPELTSGERATLASAKERAFRDALETSTLTRTRGLTELLEALDARGVTTCVVTNAPRANAEAMLTRLGLREYFGDRLVIGEECVRMKPDPAPYVEGMRRCGTENARACVAFEDSPAGARAAVAAKIRTVGILSSQTEEALVSAGCDLCVKDFAAPALLEALGLAATANR